MDDGGGGRGTVNGGGWLDAMVGWIRVGPLIETTFSFNVPGTIDSLIPYFLPYPALNIKLPI